MSRYCTVRAAAISPAPSARQRTSATQTGSSKQLPARCDAVERLHDEEHAERHREIEQRRQRARERQDEPRKIHLADQVGVADQRQARLVQRHAEQIPHEQSCEREQKVRRPLRPRAGDDAEREVQHAGGDNAAAAPPRRCRAASAGIAA